MLRCTEQRLMTKQAAASVVAAQNYRCRYYSYHCIQQSPTAIVVSAISKQCNFRDVAVEFCFSSLSLQIMASAIVRFVHILT